MAHDRKRSLRARISNEMAFHTWLPRRGRGYGQLWPLAVGCGNGWRLLDLMSLGFLPANLPRNDLPSEKNGGGQPSGVRLVCCDARP